jgi:ABC-type bacteriocin/lantibiotic exporter with double-glycine peptidase domain
LQLRHRFCKFRLLALAVLLLLASDLPSDTITTKQNSGKVDANLTKHWRQELRCGVAATYCYAQLHGMSIRYDEVEDRVHVDDRGSSLADVQKGCEAVGVPSITVYLAPSQYDTVALPIIAHIWLRPSDDAGVAAELGHYVVVFRVREHFIDLIDPTFGHEVSVTRGEFFRQASGFAIIPNMQYSMTDYLTTIAFVLVPWMTLACLMVALPKLLPVSISN